MKDIVMFCVACNKTQDTGKFCQDCGKTLNQRDYAALEEEFAKLVRQVSIKAKEANDLLKDAQKMSNELGVPFAKGTAVYIPESFYVKFSGIRPSTVESLVSSIYPSDIENESTGWITSSQRC